MGWLDIVVRRSDPAQPQSKSGRTSGTGPARVAILAEDAAGFVKPMAEGLARMIDGVGGEAVVFYSGLGALESADANADAGGRARRRGKDGASPREAPSFTTMVAELRKFDVVVVVATIPRAFLRSFFPDENVRQLLRDTPLVLYDFGYLPTRELWGQWLRYGNPNEGIAESGHWGLDRYDWYLCASVASEWALPPDPNPYSLVGLNLNDGTLHPEQMGEFTALIDFEDPKHMHERAVQVLALERTGTPYVVLNGQYSLQEIRAIYRRTSIYFVPSRQGFGLPVCELQACGSYVFTPYSNWCPAHWKKPDFTVKGEGQLSPNFVVYDNDVDRLSAEIVRVRQGYDAERVRETFLRDDAQFYWGNPEQVREFLKMVKSGAIDAQLHASHARVPLPTFNDIPDLPGRRR